MIAPSQPVAATARSWSMVEMPPEAMTGMPTDWTSRWSALTFGPWSMPSRAISVYMIRGTPSATIFWASSTAATSPSFVHPSVITMPSSESIETTIWPGKAAHASRTRSGSRTAALPICTRLAPAANATRIRSIERIPPETSTGTLTAAQIASMRAPFTGRPSFAPSRSTTWMSVPPSACQRFATVTASSA